MGYHETLPADLAAEIDDWSVELYNLMLDPNAPGFSPTFTLAELLDFTNQWLPN